MKKVAVIAIAVLFLLVGFRYVSAQQPNMAGPLTALSLNVAYQEEVPATKTLKEGRKLVTVVPGIEGKVSGQFTYEPVLYFYFDTYGNLSKIHISWLSPKTDNRIVTISCGTGNVDAPVPGLGLGGVAVIEDGMIGAKPQLSIAKPPATASFSFESVANCWFCPDGFQPLNSSGQPTGYCNGGESYVAGIMTFKGTAIKNLTTKEVSSVTLTGTLGGGGFYYLGEDDWASPNCITYSDFPSCKALFTGTFGATLTPCLSTDPNCLTVE